MASECYYIVTTKQFTLRCNHWEWLDRTQAFYNKIMFFYYNLYLDMEEGGHNLSGTGSQRIMRELEIRSIVGRDKKPVPNPLPWEKVPLYFRRAALNAASAAAKSSIAAKLERRQEVFCNAVTFYKGMYRNLTEKHIELKVWTGETWKWISCRLNGTTLPENGECLSPTLVLGAGQQFLNVPVRETVIDGRKARERIRQKARICSVQFTNRDALAVAVVLDHCEEQKGVKFFRGGDEYAHHCRIVEDKIRNSELQSEKIPKPGEYRKEASVLQNKKYWMKLKHISEYYAHNVSRQIVDYCLEQQADILLLPEYSKCYSKVVMHSAGSWSPIRLSCRIRQQLSYKAWKAGIIILETSPAKCGSVCSVCGGGIKKVNSEFVCENGHTGSRYVNSARNLGRKCLASFQR